MLKPLFRWLVVAVLLAAVPGVALAQDAEEKVYKQAYNEVKGAFDQTKAGFDAVYGPIKEARAAIDQWRRATTRATAKDAIKTIEDMTKGGVTAARDELVARVFGADALEALKTLEKMTGKTLVPEAKGLLDMLRSPQDHTDNYGYMYGLSALERRSLVVTDPSVGALPKPLQPRYDHFLLFQQKSRLPWQRGQAVNDVCFSWSSKQSIV